MARSDSGPAQAPRSLLRAAAGLLIGALAATNAAAAVTPTYPGPGVTFNEGTDCTIKWSLDTTAGTTWTNFDIDLMTGPNLAMVNVTRVASGLDGTTGTGVYTYPCPNVSPNSAIYFYQMTSGGAGATWTTRFTIASASGAVTTPQHATQDGKAIPWGTGKLSGTQPVNSNTVAPATTATDSASATDDGNAAAATATTDADADAATATADATSTAPPVATSSAAAHQSSSTSTGLFSTLKPTFRYIVYAGIGVLGALILALVIWGLCRCCKRSRAKPTDKGYVPKPVITHNVPSSAALARNLSSKSTDKYARGDTSIDTWVEPPSPYEEKFGAGRADERWEMAPTGGAHAAQRADWSPPPGWTAPAQYDLGHSAVSFADDTPLVKPLTRQPTQQSAYHAYGGARPEVHRNPSSASTVHNQRNRYTQQQVDGYGQDQGEYEREQRAAWNSLPQRGHQQQQQHQNWI